MSGQLDRRTILRGLDELRRRDNKRRVFGADAHQYKLRPPRPVAEIEAFEARYRIKLPDDYRYFITEIGDGGAGPYYGVLPFGQDDDGDDYCDGGQGQLVGELSKPFPHVTAWNLPDSFWSSLPDLTDEMTTDEQDRLMEARDEELERNYWNPSLVDGAIPICHLGCALRQWLVIHGDQKGYVWGDGRVDEEGLFPLKDKAGAQMTFSDWYLSWLQNALRENRSGLVQEAKAFVRGLIWRR